MANKKVKYIVLDEDEKLRGVYDTLDEAKRECYDEYVIYAVTDRYEADYTLKFTKTKLD